MRTDFFPARGISVILANQVRQLVCKTPLARFSRANSWCRGSDNRCLWLPVEEFLLSAKFCLWLGGIESNGAGEEEDVEVAGVAFGDGSESRRQGFGEDEGDEFLVAAAVGAEATFQNR